MKILVYVKQVPDTDDVKLDPKTGNIMREGVASKLNPLDANAVEAAIRLKEKYGAQVCAISMGPPQAEDVLKKALALGCDEAYLLSDRAFGGADTLATSYTLAMAARKIGDYDLLLFGRHAVDGDTAQTGPATAAQLGIPQITLASSIDVQDGYVICDRVLETCTQKVRARLPALAPTAWANSARSLSVIWLFRRMTRFAREVRVSSSFAPMATLSISSFMLTEGLRSRVRVSVFLDLVTPTASTITK